MTDEAKALVERLREEVNLFPTGDGSWVSKVRNPDGPEAADLIETQAREIERLRRSAEYWKSICKIQTRETQSQQSKWTEALSRAALGDSHD